ncbi:HD domain-containing protein [candidate division NPL-UPA2 bacterium]|nr:HD domain-containing protein [candidate division NPL-UPA2 bacterium]
MRIILDLNVGIRKLLILLLTITACLVLTFYVNFILVIDVPYTHAFYIPIVLAGIWYYSKKAVCLALFFGLIHIFALYLSPPPLTVHLEDYFRGGAFIIVAYAIGFISRKSEESLRKRTEQVIRHQAALLELTKLNYSDLDLALKTITEMDSKTLGVERVSIWLFTEDHSEVVCEDLYKLSENLHEKGLRFGAYDSPRYFQALEDGRAIAVNDACTDPRTSELSDVYFNPHGITSVMDVPVRLHGKLVGLVCHEYLGPRREWTLEEQDFAASIADIVSIALESSERYQVEQALRSSFIQLAETVSRAMETHDPYTTGHQRRVADMSRQVGEKMGLDEKELQGLYIAGLLHDVGKISIPAVILTYPGKLNEVSWALIRSHPYRGYEILKETQFPWPVADMVLHHHERLDGFGYPDGLKGGELSREVRILAVCDVVEAMSSRRPYRPARSREEVREELQGGRGIKYDPEVVDILLNFLSEGQLDTIIQFS